MLRDRKLAKSKKSLPEGARKPRERQGPSSRRASARKDSSRIERTESDSREELEVHIESQARELLGIGRAEAFERLERGDLRGTAAEAELKVLKYLLDEASK